MKKKLKILLSLIVLVVLILFVILIFADKKQENVLQETHTINEVENVIDNTQEIPIETNAIETSNTIIENEIQESIIQENTTQVTTKEPEEKPKTSSAKMNSSSSKTKSQTTNENTQTKTEIQTQTKDEPNNNTIVKPTEDTTKPTEKVENTNINNNNNKTDKNTKPEETKTEPTIKKISQEEYNAEVQKYLQDIQAIKPGLKYKEAKRGQVFWPYRTSEIESAVGGVSFGIVYYYVDIFIEGNEEKFKYYIDWAGNE